MNKNKYMGISKVGEKGQIVIPKEVRDNINIILVDDYKEIYDVIFKKSKKS